MTSFAERVPPVANPRGLRMLAGRSLVRTGQAVPETDRQTDTDTRQALKAPQPGRDSRSGRTGNISSRGQYGLSSASLSPLSYSLFVFILIVLRLK